jgi:isochorismate hydrolase
MEARSMPDAMLIIDMQAGSFGQSDHALLRQRNASRVIIAGRPTDFCVDTTVRSCTARGFQTWAVADGHTVSDRPHLPAAKIIEHHNFIWSDLIAPGGAVKVVTCQELITGSSAE